MSHIIDVFNAYWGAAALATVAIICAAVATDIRDQERRG